MIFPSNFYVAYPFILLFEKSQLQFPYVGDCDKVWQGLQCMCESVL